MSTSRNRVIFSLVALTRSEQMARIRATDTEPERRLARALWNEGVRYRLHARTEAGPRPDIVVSRAKLAIFVDGCFWHGCPDHYVRPRTARLFWGRKLRENVMRDIRQTAVLKQLGWTVVRVWEHQVFTDLAAMVTVIKSLGVGSGPVCIQVARWRVLRVVSRDKRGDHEEQTLIDLMLPHRHRKRRHLRHTQKWLIRPSDETGRTLKVGG